MAVCVPSEGYGEFAQPLACYGVPYPGPQASPQVMSSDQEIVQSPWNNQCAEPVQYWQGEQCADQSPQGGVNGFGAEDSWLGPQGGMPFMAPGGGHGGWVSGGLPAMQMPPRPNGHPNGGGSGHQPTRLKRRFCTSFPDVQLCRRGGTCAFAHTREEIRAPLLAMEEENQELAAMTDEFFMYKYKTLWCPIGVQHEWHTCVYGHNYQDARRPVNIGYGARLCPYWSKKDTGAEYSQRCPLGLRCPYAHGAKEQLYHPQYFKTVVCRDLRLKTCPRQGLCAFFHHRAEKRSANPPSEDIDYSQPLPEEALQSDWISEFLTPPFLPEHNRGNEDGVMHDGSSNMIASYNGNQAQSSPYGMQQPYVFLLPYPPQMSNGSPMQQPAQMGSPMLGPMGSPMGQQMVVSSMGSPMNNNMNSPGAGWVFVPLESPQHA